MSDDKQTVFKDRAEALAEAIPRGAQQQLDALASIADDLLGPDADGAYWATGRKIASAVGELRSALTAYQHVVARASVDVLRLKEQLASTQKHLRETLAAGATSADEAARLQSALRDLQAAPTHLSTATVEAMVEQLELFCEGDRHPTLYLGPVLVALLDLAAEECRGANLNERLEFVRRTLRLCMTRCTGHVTPKDVERWVTSIAAQMRGTPETSSSHLCHGEVRDGVALPCEVCGRPPTETPYAADLQERFPLQPVPGFSAAACPDCGTGCAEGVCDCTEGKRPSLRAEVDKEATDAAAQSRAILVGLLGAHAVEDCEALLDERMREQMDGLLPLERPEIRAAALALMACAYRLGAEQPRGQSPPLPDVVERPICQAPAGGDW